MTGVGVFGFWDQRRGKGDNWGRGRHQDLTDYSWSLQGGITSRLPLFLSL